jgi:nucleoside-diphosphate-sugar epimerase
MAGDLVFVTLFFFFPLSSAWLLPNTQSQITGSTGFVGFAVLKSLLHAGYHVRISLRKKSQIPTIKNHVSIAPFASAIEFVIVPDITISGAFDKVLDGVKYVLHTASPIPFAVSLKYVSPSFHCWPHNTSQTKDPETDIINPAIHGTTSILNSALKFPSIIRVVITSSITAVIPPAVFFTGDATTIYNSSSRIRPLPTGPWSDPRIAYLHAKTLALDATETFQKEKKPKFTIVNFMPGYVVDRNELATNLKTLGTGSNRIVVGIISGVVAPSPSPNGVVHIDDVARIHVEALDSSKVRGNRDFILSAGVERYDDAEGIVRKAYPDAVGNGLLELGGSTPTTRMIVDIRETVEVFGEFKTYEEMVKSVAGQYIELKK